MFIFETGQAFCQIMVPYAIKEIIDLGSTLRGSFSQALFQLKPALILFVSLSIGILFFSRASGALLVLVGPSMRRRVRRTIFNYLQFHSQTFFINNFSGSLANRISEIAQGVNHSVWTILFDFWPVIVTFSTSLILMYKVSVGLAIPLGIWTIVYILVSFLLATRCQQYAKDFAATRSIVSGKIVDSVTNSLNTKIFAMLGYERSYLDNYLNIEVAAARRTFWFMEVMRWFQFLATMTLQVGVILLAMKFWLTGQISVGSFAMVTSLALMVINDARGLSRRFLEFFEYMGNISDGVSIIVRNHDVVDSPNAKPIQISQGEVLFRDVTFGYSPDRLVFERLNIRIGPGERVGLVGFSGSGKTTFINLILRMYDVNSGAVLIDGQNISEYTQDSLREQVSMIPQDPMLFHRSLLDNIRYGRPNATDDEVFRAAKAARAHEFITQLSDGYASLVGERGVKLSGGQRQRIAIARAILKNSSILILDEATSSLDSVTEKAVQSSFESVMKGHTVIVVAHRLSTIAQLDRIIVFNEGQIVEDGSHKTLLALNGHYARLWKMQVGGFLPETDAGSTHDTRRTLNSV
ncbi:MAG: ABC transporter ATP-binding protein [Bdellovibrionales bacterium]|nr:ABC transporter ATP-binding protein [Bdellovibrionales bacterium]